MVAIHVDFFILAGMPGFIEQTIATVSSNLKISKIEHGSFQFTGIDITKNNDESITVSIDYTRYQMIIYLLYLLHTVIRRLQY